MGTVAFLQHYNDAAHKQAESNLQLKSLTVKYSENLDFLKLKFLVVFSGMHYLSITRHV